MVRQIRRCAGVVLGDTLCRVSFDVSLGGERREARIWKEMKSGDGKSRG